MHGKCLALYSLSVVPPRLGPLTEDTSMITVSSCGVKLKEVLSGLVKSWTYTCTFVAFLNIHSFIHSFIALHIRPTDLELINRDEGITIPECWQPVLDHAKTTGFTHATPRRGTDDGTIDAT